MKKSIIPVFYILGGTLISSLAGYVLTGNQIFDVQSQFFHFILAGFSISLMWVDDNNKNKIPDKGVLLLSLFILYRLLLDVPFTHLIGRDIVYFLMFIIVYFVPPGLWNRMIMNRPVVRFLGSGLVVSIGYSLSAVILDYIYPSAMATLFELVKVNFLYGLTIGMAVSLGFELIHAIITGVHAESFD